MAGSALQGRKHKSTKEGDRDRGRREDSGAGGLTSLRFVRRRRRLRIRGYRRRWIQGRLGVLPIGGEGVRLRWLGGGPSEERDEGGSEEDRGRRRVGSDRGGRSRRIGWGEKSNVGGISDEKGCRCMNAREREGEQIGGEDGRRGGWGQRRAGDIAGQPGTDSERAEVGETYGVGVRREGRHDVSGEGVSVDGGQVVVEWLGGVGVGGESGLGQARLGFEGKGRWGRVTGL